MSWKEVADELERAERIVAQMEADGHDENLDDDVFRREEEGEDGGDGQPRGQEQEQGQQEQPPPEQQPAPPEAAGPPPPPRGRPDWVLQPTAAAISPLMIRNEADPGEEAEQPDTPTPPASPPQAQAQAARLRSAHFESLATEPVTAARVESPADKDESSCRPDRSVRDESTDDDDDESTTGGCGSHCRNADGEQGRGRDQPALIQKVLLSPPAQLGPLRGRSSFASGRTSATGGAGATGVAGMPSERKGSSGILRLDGAFSARRRGSAEPASPSPSADRLSVTFAVDDGGDADAVASANESSSEREREATAAAAERPERTERHQVVVIVEDNPRRDDRVGGSGGVSGEGLLHPPGALLVTVPEDDANAEVNPQEALEEEYTDSLMEIVRSRSRSRRRSSGLDAAGRRVSVTSGLGLFRRRRSSAVTLESADGAESDLTRSSIFSKRSDQETLKLHREVIELTKYQLWPLDKKLRIMQQAKDYVRRHESELEEQLAQHRTFASTVLQAKMLLAKMLQFSWRMLRELALEMIPWQQRIKDIESHFGSVVSSYFIFLRWLFWMNFAITLVITFFVIIPEVLAADWEGTGARKKMLPVESLYAYNLKVMWDFEGVFRYSPIFYGYFSDRPATKAGYQIPLAYFCVGMAVYIFSFATILKKMAHNSKQSKLSEKKDECTFTWKVFASWDYGIANVETAHNKVAAIVMGFREALVEELEKEKLQEQSWKTIAKRALANLLVLALLIGSAYTVVAVVERSAESEASTSWYRQNEITIVMSLISICVPNIFEVIGLLEQYHPRKAMRWMLARIMVLNLLSLYTLILALFGKTDGMIHALGKMEEMRRAGANFGLEPETPPPPALKDCFQVPVPCELLSRDEPSLPPILSLYYEFDETNGYFATNFTLASTTEAAEIASYEKSATTAPPHLNATSLLEQWLDNLTQSSSLSSAESASAACAECISRCGQECFDACSFAYKDCGQNSSDTEGVATLIVAIREVLTSTETLPADFSDSFSVCRSCASTATTSSSSSSPPTSTTAASSMGVSVGVPLESRHCTKQICRRRFFGAAKPTHVQPPRETCASAENRYINDLKEKLYLRQLCWETMFGQELVKLTVMDTVFTLGTIFIGDFLRSLFLRVLNPCWFWDMEKNFPKYPDFKVAENILHLVNNQGMIWMGLFMAPGLPAINLVKLAIIMYARSWAVMTTNVPHETVFRASRSNNFYFILLLMMLFLCTLPVAYAIVWLKPSWHCGPFSRHDRMYKVFTGKLLDLLPARLHGVLDYVTSPGVVIPVFVLLVLVIYYLVSLTGLLRESNEDLKNQLHHERTEERRKLLAARQGGAGAAAASSVSDRWKRLLGSAINSARQSKDTTAQEHRKTGDALAAFRATTGESASAAFNERAVDVPGSDENASSKVSLADVIRLRMRQMQAESSPGAEAAAASDRDKGSMCNRFRLETECSSSASSHANEAADDEGNRDENDEDEEDDPHPPKIWISKSASMEELEKAAK